MLCDAAQSGADGNVHILENLEYGGIRGDIFLGFLERDGIAIR